MKLERCSELRVPVQAQGRPAPAAALAALLADPQRVLQQLLRGEQLQAQADGLFLYTPRPLELPGLRLAPAVRFAAQWQEPLLRIQLVETQLPGLAKLERAVRFAAQWQEPLLRIQLVETQLPGLAKLERAVRYRFSAELEPAEGCVQVRAQATLELADGLGLPPPLLAFLGQRALGLIFGRLERRVASVAGPLDLAG